METIELLSCCGCQRIIDHTIFTSNCKRCHSKFFRTIGPSWWILVKWFVFNPKHVIKLLIQDIREKYHDKKRS